MAAASHHVHVEYLLAKLFCEVYRRDAVGADGCRGEVDHQYAELVELARVFGVNVGRGGVEGDADIIGVDVRQEPVDAIGCDFQSHFLGALQTIGFGVDTHHPDRLQHVTALQLVEKVGTNVAGPDQGASDFACHGLLSRS
ncbi:hypothetical protein D9M70_561260 [compost metagenome]